MAPPNNRKEILGKLRKLISDGTVIVGAGAGIGLSAKFIEQGGGDLIIIYNSGRFRMAGRGSLAGLMPYGNANDVVLEMVSSYRSDLSLRAGCLRLFVGKRSPARSKEDASSGWSMRH